VPPRSAKTTPVKKGKGATLPIFNKKELRVIQLTCKQLTAKEIGEKMGLDFRTIEMYRAEIFRKMKVRNIVGMALWAVKKGLVKL
jgi:DNA-binding NarL/FixJ family response regulator